MCCVVFVGIVYISPSIAVSSPFNMGGNTLGNQNIGALSYSWEFNSTGSFVGSSPVVALGHVYVANTNGQVVALDPSGLNDCSFNSMDICTPQFTFATPPNQPVYATPVVSGNLLLISVADIVYAFDATGSQNCSGTTIICTPLWSTEPMGGINMSTPVIFGSNFIVHDSIGLYSFSTTGVNCTSSSSSLVCNPLWSAPYGNQSYMPPAIYNTTVFSTSGGKLLAFDANGVVNCRGIPDVCNPEWTAQSAEDQLGVAVDSSTGEVFTASNYVYGFDANGITNCSNGTCSPIWQGAVAGSFSQFYSPIEIFDNILYIEGSNELYSYNVINQITCSTTLSLVCSPNWEYSITNNLSSTVPLPAPTVANGLLFVGGSNDTLYVFPSDDTSCVAVSPMPQCSSLKTMTVSGAIDTSPTYYAGDVYVASSNGTLYSFGNAPIDLNFSGTSISDINISEFPMFPSFSPNTHNYAIYCDGISNTITLNVEGASSALSFEGTSNQSFTINGQIYANQALVVIGPPSSDFSNSDAQYWIRCLPPSFPHLTVHKYEAVQKGYYLTTFLNTGFAENVILDTNGVPIWYQSRAGTEFNYIGNGNFSTIFAGADLYGDGFTSFNIANQTQTTFEPPSGIPDIHDFLVRPDGNMYGFVDKSVSGGNFSSFGYGSNMTYLDCVLEEYNSLGQLIWEWDPIYHVSLSESLHRLISVGSNIVSPYHCNSIDVSPNGSRVLVGMRNTSAVYEINKYTSKIIWKLGGNNVVGDNEQHILVTGDSQGTFYGQHSAYFGKDLNHIYLYDDHTNSQGVANGLEVNVDQASGTASVLHQFLNPSGTNTQATGSFYAYDNGNDNLVAWGAVVQNSTPSGFTEFNQSGKILLNVTYSYPVYSYRVIKIPTTAISLTLLRQTCGLPFPSTSVPLPIEPAPLNPINDSSYHALSPVRVVDTRYGSNNAYAGMTLSSGSILSVSLTKYIPSTATGVYLNVTVTNTDSSSFLTAYDSSESRPNTSVLNWNKGSTKANLVEVSLSPTQTVDFYNDVGNVDLVVDLEGYIGPSLPGGGLFKPSIPTRICDSRSVAPANQCSNMVIGPGSNIQVKVAGYGGVPLQGVQAVSLNITATNESTQGYLSVGATSNLNTSNLNWSSGLTVANHVISLVNKSGYITVSNASGFINLIVDLDGYFTDSSNQLSNGLTFTPIDPTRVVDSRFGTIYDPTIGQIKPNSAVSFNASSVFNIDTADSVLVTNITVISNGGSGYLVANSGESLLQDTSTLNYSPNNPVVANLALVKLGNNGEITVTNFGNTSVNIIIDVTGWYS